MRDDMSQKETLSMLCMGIAGESGEVVELFKKHLYHDHELNKNDLIKELGDIHFYLANLMNVLEINEEEVFQRNIDKLRKRYPNGFNALDSKKRVDTQEKES